MGEGGEFQADHGVGDGTVAKAVAGPDEFEVACRITGKGEVGMDGGVELVWDAVGRLAHGDGVVCGEGVVPVAVVLASLWVGCFLEGHGDEKM